MDINFHYFAMKRIAAVAGFEEEAQLIAEYSQVVDEYADSNKYHFEEYKVPAYARHLRDGKGYFHAVQTGFVSRLDYAALMFRDNQVNYLIPFHFPPFVASGAGVRVSESYQVQRSVKGDHSIISDMLEQEAVICRSCMVDTPERRRSLISLGVLLHVFADTYAHENFNGFQGNVNCASLEEAVRMEGLDVRAKMGASQVLPAIGHGKVGVAPDVTSVHFKVQQGEAEWERSNWVDFMDCAMEILRFLTYACRGEEPDGIDIENMQEALEEGFAVKTEDYKDPSLDKLIECWENTATAIPPVRFYYDKKQILGRITPFPENMEELGISKAEYYEAILDHQDPQLTEKLLAATYGAKDDFFIFNCVAYRIRIGNYLKVKCYPNYAEFTSVNHKMQQLSAVTIKGGNDSKIYANRVPAQTVGAIVWQR